MGPRYSQTQFEVESILQKKRALREKNESSNVLSDNRKRSDVKSEIHSNALKSKSVNTILATPERREFGRAFSPTIYTPTREERFNEDYSSFVTSEVGKFLALLLSVDINALRLDYSEDTITNHLRSNGIPLSSELTQNLPVIYNSYDDYKKTYLPLIFYDCWAQMVEDYYSSNSKRLQVYINSIDTMTDPKVTTLVLRCLVPSNQIHYDDYSIENWLTLLQLDLSQSAVFDENDKTVSPHNEELQKMKALGFVYSYNKLIGKSAENFTKYLAEKNLPVLKSSDDGKLIDYIPCEYIVKVFTNSYILELIKGQKKLFLRPVYYIRPTVRYIETLSMMKFKDEFQQSFLKPDKDVCLLECNPHDDFILYEAEKFNEQQRNAIVSCFNAVQLPYSTNKTVMIQGPPGTGKTHTLVGIIKNTVCYN